MVGERLHGLTGCYGLVWCVVHKKAGLGAQPRMHSVPEAHYWVRNTCSSSKVRNKPVVDFDLSRAAGFVQPIGSQSTGELSHLTIRLFADLSDGSDVRNVLVPGIVH